MAPLKVLLEEQLRSVSMVLVCACVCFYIHIYMCILLYTSYQTLGFTRVWLPAPAVKHHGVLSWKSKVQHGLMIAWK